MCRNNFSKCRLCLYENSPKIEIFQSTEKYCDLIKKYTGEVLIQDDKLPSKFCDECLSELLIIIKFVSKVKSSNKVFNEILQLNTVFVENQVPIKYEADDEEKLPLSVLGAALKREMGLPSEDDASLASDHFADTFDDIKTETYNQNYRCQPNIVSLDNLSTYLKAKKNHNFLCVTVNDLTIKKEKTTTQVDLIPPVKSKKKVKKRLKEKHLKSEVDSHYAVMKAKEHGLLKDMVKCLTCGCLLHNRSAFLVHYRRHTGERPFSCKRCIKTFSQLGALNEHTRSVHLGLKRHKVQEQKTPVIDPDENVIYKLLKAQEYSLLKDKVQCLTCLLVCENKSAFIVHYRKHSGEKPFKCEQCDKSFPRMGSLTDHIKNIHPDPDNPPEKGQKLPGYGENTLYTHVKTDDHPGLQRDMVQCLTCKLLFNDKVAFRIHYRKHTGEKPFKCEDCSKLFRRMGDLNEHIRKIHSKKGFSRSSTMWDKRPQESCICDMCGKTFKHKSSLTIHLRTHTDEKPHECSYCNKRFIRSQELSLHVRIHHTGEKPYTCHLCGKTFAAGTQLKSHLFVHTDEKNFKCKICDTSVKTRDSLAKHVRVMHTTRKNVCEVCGAAFAFKYSLRDHIKNRHSERSEMCDICKKPFSELQKHMITHSDQKPFACQLCQKGFFRHKSLKAHLTKHHNDDHLPFV